MNSPDLPPAVFDEVDCKSFWLWQSLAWKQSLRARIGTVKELVISAWFARRTVRRFSSVICAGETDARWLRWIGGRSSVEVVSNGVALPDLGRGYESTDSVPNRLRLCFVGTLNFKPNILAIEFLVDEIWPLVRSVYPEAELLIAGRIPRTGSQLVQRAIRHRGPG